MEAEVLYEIRRHASRSLPFGPSPNQTSEGLAGSGFLSYLSFQGVTKIKEKLSSYYRETLSGREKSLIVSPNGKYVAVCACNQIIILNKDNNYMEPFGVYTNNEKSVVFSNGAWFEAEGILVIIDNLNTLYLIKTNGEEIAKRNNKQLKISLPVSGIFVIIEDSISNLGKIIIFTSDGAMHQFGVTKEKNGSVFINSISDLNNNLGLIKINHVSCLDFNPNLSLLAVIGTSNANSGSYSLYLLQVNTNSELKFLSCGPEFKGSFSFSPPKDQNTLESYPKIQISPKGKYIATLDSLGFLNIFKFESNSNSLSHHLSLEREEYFNNIVDITWWSDEILTVANRGKNVILYDVRTNKKVSQTIISNPILEGIKNEPGNIFALESQKQEENINIWTLISLTKVSISEMYKILMKNKNYENALDFATMYDLNKDEVFKSQWSDSDKGIYEINSCLSKIKDKIFILSECVNSVGPTEAVLRALINFGFSITDNYKFNDESLLACDMRIFRLRLLQVKDRLETFLGINMGRFSGEEYSKFLSLPLVKTAILLAENGKIGALNLLFKRHPYTISPNILKILSSVPETVPVNSYSQLLPGTNPPNTTLLREPDWVECDKMVYYIEKSINPAENTEKIKTEIILKISNGFIWPSVNEISDWYINRAREIDILTGQLDNSISLIELASQKGITGILQFLDEIKYLYHLVYSNEQVDFNMDLATWESLSKYEKFKLMIKGAKEENIVQKLSEKAIPYMLKYKEEGENESYLVKWLKVQAKENNLSICSGVFENACGEQNKIEGLFEGILEIVQTGIECVYICGATDKWNIMGNILSNLLNLIARERVSSESLVSGDLLDKLEKKIRVSQGHVEVGRLLAYYQVPKPMSFLITSQSDEKNIRQIIRLILSKFSRRQPGRSDADWAAMWRDLIGFQEKAFSFLDSEYLLTEFVRGLLKAGRFSVARNYLKGINGVSLSHDKAENLVVNAAKEYFFSASSLSSSEIWKARECLGLLPNNRNVQAELDIIDAITIRLPELGTTLLPMQFKQLKDPMEAIKTIITTQPGAYLNIEEIIEISKLLGLKSEEEISLVEELIAREAVLNGDLQLASDLCLGFVKKGHGQAWDLCVSIARAENRDLENLDLESRKRFLGFALCYCDEESMGDLLSAWKDLEMRENLERIRVLGANSKKAKGVFAKDEKVNEMLLKVCNEVPKEEKQRKKILSFAEKELPWLMDLCIKDEHSKKNIPKIPLKKHYFSAKTQAINSIISFLATNDFSPKDELIASLARSVLGPPVSEADDILGLLFLLNLVDPLKGVGIIEEEIKKREEYCEIHSIMGLGMAYSSLNNSSKECNSPQEKRELLLHGIYDKISSLDTDEMEEEQNTFWREWKLKLEEEKRLNEQTRALEKIIPGIEASKFLSGDKDYVKNAVFTFVDSVKLEKKKGVLKDAVKLADTYGLQRTEVLLHFFGCVLVSDCWENQDILSEITEFRDQIVKNAMQVIHLISSSVYPQINGQNKQRLAYIFSILSACHSRLKKSLDPVYIKFLDHHSHSHSVDLSQYYKVLEQECMRVSFIKDLDFKNIAGLVDLNFESFNEEVCRNVSENTVEVLAEMVNSIVGIYDNALTKGLVLKEGVYKHYILGLLASLEGKNEARPGNNINADALQNKIREIEINFDKCEKYVYFLSQYDISFIIGRYFTLCLPINFSRDPLDDPNWKNALIFLINFWIKIVREIQDKISLLNCLEIFEGFINEGIISINQGWEIVSKYLKLGFSSGLSSDISFFCKSMILSGSEFESIGDIYYSVSENQNFNLVELYNNVASTCLSGLTNGSDSNQDLYNLLSSLSKFSEKHSENMKIIRSEIWGQLCNFLEKKELDNNTRVFALQLMQAMKGENTKTLPYEIISLVEKWESFDESYSLNNNNIINNNNNLVIGQENPVLFSSSITNTLIALKSTQLISSIIPNIIITPEDLQTLDSAVSRFLHLSEIIAENISIEKINILILVLEEWEQLFCLKTNPEEMDTSKDQNELINNNIIINDNDDDNNEEDDEWDNDGWETFPDEVVNTNKSEIKSELIISIHPLHTCYMDLVHKLIKIGDISKVIELFDRSIYKSKSLLDEQESNNLIQILGKKDLFLLLKLLSMLPHEKTLDQCLQLIETKLKNSTVYDASYNNDFDLLTLVLFSDFIKTGHLTYPKLFSYLCYLIGHLARVCQEGIVKDFNLNSQGQNRKEKMLFVHVLFPYFISELVIKGEYLLAGFMVSKWNHTNGSLGLIDTVPVSLRKYLEGQILVQIQNRDLDSSGTIGFVISVLRSRLVPLLQSAVLALPEESDN